MNLGHIGFPGITLVIMKRAWKMHFQPPHNEIKCVLSIKESYPKRGKNAKVFTNIYGLRVPPPFPPLMVSRAIKYPILLYTFRREVFKV